MLQLTACRLFSGRVIGCAWLAMALCAIAGLIDFCAADELTGPASVKVALDADAAAGPIDGRLYLFLSKRGGVPMRGPDWFRPEPFFRLDVRQFGPGETRLFDDRAVGFPDVLSKLPAGRYRAQAILDHDIYEPKAADGVCNFYSEIVELELAADDGDSQGRQTNSTLHLTKVVAATPFPDSKWVKEVVLRSEQLARFHGREIIERASVVLPASYYDQPDRRYPAMYIVPGFGGSHREGLRYAAEPPKHEENEAEFLRVYLSGRCKWGHHVYADSDTNGPRGETLVREIIPLIDGEFRTIALPTARFVMGHSSGGWSSLWLQVTYPDVFGGVWSSSPDPVDFRDYQQVNLYAEPSQNMYRDQEGNRRPIARRGEEPVLWYDQFTKMDDVIGRGGQLRSFEAVFSPLDNAGLPKRLWDRASGDVDAAVAKAWERYDISLVLKRDWPRLKTLLAGKLHVTMGTLDTFYLDGATRRLAERLGELGSDAEVTFVEGASHGSVLTQAYYGRVRQEMSEEYWKHHQRIGVAIDKGK